MKRIAAVLTIAALPLSLSAQNQLKRPKITGIDHVRLFVTNVEKSREFYTQTIGLLSGGASCKGVLRPCLSVNSHQYIELDQLIASDKQLAGVIAIKSFLAEVALATDNVPQMRGFLLASGISVSAISKDAKGAQHFELADPEGHLLAFVQPAFSVAIDDPPPSNQTSNQISTRLLHAGFVVKDLERMKKFYLDLLGFRLYWYGGFKDSDIDWYEIQVPDGDNWIEFMLNIPANADHKELGVQNHFSLGVKDIHVAAELLRKHGLQEFDGPEIGRDGKQGLDIYDPDGTRVEFMEFTPTKVPCCHPYTAPHAKP